MQIYGQFRTLYRQFLAPQHDFMRVYFRTPVRNLAHIVMQFNKIFTFHTIQYRVYNRPDEACLNKLY